MPQDSEPKGDIDEQEPSTTSAAPGGQIDGGAGGYQFFVDPAAGTVSGYSYGLDNSSGGVNLNAGLPDWFSNTTQSTPSTASQTKDTSVAAVAPSSPASSSVASGALPSSTAASAVSYTQSVPASEGFEAIAGYNSTPDFDLQSASAFMTDFQMPEALPLAKEVDVPQSAAIVGETAEPQKVPEWVARTVDDAQLRSYKTPQAAKNSLVSLYLREDSRYKALVLPDDMEIAVSRIFGLVDLDFNGYVEFEEMHRVLESDDLSASEKGIVKLVLSEARKILIERKLPEEGALLALTREDFKLAFAREYAGFFASMGIKSPSAGAPVKVAFKAQLYSQQDFPLASIKPEAVSVGLTGDAYFASVTASLAAQNPRAILRILRTNLDHTYNVGFAGARQKPFDVMPPRTDELIEYGRTDKYGFWYPLVEKSFGIYQAKGAGLAGRLKSDNNRSETLSRIALIYETLLAKPVQQTVLADASPSSIFDMVCDLFSQQKVIIAVARDDIDASKARLARYPKAGKPYPLTAVDVIQKTVRLSQIYNHDVEPIECPADQFCTFFKLLYFNREPESQSIPMTAPSGSGDNPWKRIN